MTTATQVNLPTAIGLQGLVLVAVYLLATWLTRGMIRWAPRWGLVDHPGARRIHLAPTPRAGGIAVFLALVAGLGLTWWCGLATQAGSAILQPRWQACFLLGSLVLLTVGILDDRHDLSAWWKLGAQVAAALIMYAHNPEGMGRIYGYQLPWVLDCALHVAWVVVLINAFNLIDGMDGLCAGLGAISLAILGVLAAVGPRPGDAWVIAVMIVSLVAFLRFNFHPARIFLGDAGSMLIGFFIAAAGTATVGRNAVMAGVLLPLLVAGVPLFDVVLAVWRRYARQIARHRTGQAAVRIFGADRDHLHHRLLEWGLTQRQAAMMMYGVAAVLAVLAVVPMLGGGNYLAFSVVGLFVIVLVGLRYVAPVEVLESGEGLRAFVRRPVSRSRMVLTYFIYDTVALTVAAVIAFFLVEKASRIPADWQTRLLTVSTYVACCLLGLRFARAHTRRWMRAGIHDFAETAAWLLCGAILSGGLVSVFLQDVSWRVILMHGMALALTLLAVFAPRSVGFALQEGVIDAMHRRRGLGAKGGRPTLLYGAGDLGELFLCNLRLSPGRVWSAYSFKGYLDDHPALTGRRLRGFLIFGTLDQLDSLAQAHKIECVIVTQSGLVPERRKKLLEIAARRGIEVREWVPDLGSGLVQAGGGERGPARDTAGNAGEGGEDPRGMEG